MGEASPGSALEVWEQREWWGLHMVPYASMAVSVFLFLIQNHHSTATLGETLGLAGLALAWVAWMITLHPAWIRRRRLMSLYYVVLLVLIVVLVTRDARFGFFALTGYTYAFYLPFRFKWRLAGVAITAFAIAGAEIFPVSKRTPAAIFVYLVIWTANATGAGFLIFFGRVGVRLRDARKTMVVELAEANAMLEATLEENAGLHTQLLTQAREAGVLDERQRMAREIHDTLAQGLTGIVAQLEAARRARERAGQWERHVDQAYGLARDSLTEARRSVQALRPEPLEDARLPDAIGVMAHRWSQNSMVPVSVEIAGEPQPMVAEIEIALFRVAQEALANVAKHAGASNARITLSYTEEVVLLDVRDDGMGFTIDANGSGFGLSGMRQRVRQVAGTLEIESIPGEGTTVNACVPAIPSADLA